MSKESTQELARLVEGIRSAMLTTVDQDGLLHSRPMATLDIHPDEAVLWFFTADPSPKTSELLRVSDVNVAYASPDGCRYVSVAGKAQVVRDREKMEELWSDVYRHWFPDGMKDPHLALIRVEIYDAQYWEQGQGRQFLRFPRDFEIKKVSFR